MRAWWADNLDGEIFHSKRVQFAHRQAGEGVCAHDACIAREWDLQVRVNIHAIVSLDLLQSTPSFTPLDAISGIGVRHDCVVVIN